VDAGGEPLEQGMNITEPFVLRHDVLLIPCAELSEDMRGRITFDEGDFTLSRRQGRALSQVIDGETAALLELFRKPRTIIDAVLENSRSFGRNPAVLLDELLPHLGTFLNNHVLVPAGSEEEQELRAAYESGQSLAGWEIVRCASLVEDTEIYQVRRDGELAALKIARIDTPALRSMFENERDVLRHLDGAGIAPRLLDSGVAEERPYLVMEWLAGVDSGVAAAQRRHDRVALIELCVSIANAYATLHERGVLHADVHPRNVMAGDGGAMLLDFGLSRLAGRPPHVGRGGMYFFYEPELLSAPQQWMLPASEAGEQYALAALLYLLVSGHHYLDFRYEREAMTEQVKTEAPLPFAKRGVPPWPEVEEILARALAKDPAQRHASLAEMAARLADVRESVVREALSTPVSAEANAFLDAALQALARGGAVYATGYPAPPTASVCYGCAGAAVGLLRVAETRSDPALVALADIWRSRAMALIGTEGAYHNAAFAVSREELGDVSPYHTEAGIHAAGAMIAASIGDTYAHRRGIHGFLHASSRPCAQLDLTLGRSGSLLIAAMLLELGEEQPLRALGTATMKAVWDELDARPAIDGFLGLSHGWAGYFYAALRWCEASGDPLPPRLTERLDDYLTLHVPRGRGVQWPITAGGTSFMPGWCNGSAGQVFLFTLAHRALGGERWLQLAEACAWTAWDEPRGIADLCCGTAGRAYALLNLYKHTGATEWLSRARQLANHAATSAAATAERPYALWKGELGVAVLIADLASPENARMPFVE
jgi:eukaryotic-like serine/threonine-protein kinase